MRKIVHISDLHFGNNDPGLLEPLRQAIKKIAPQILIVSGDFVEHATAAEFEQARAFLDSLPQPQILVPGNHDLPFYNLWERAYMGLSRYRRILTPDTSPRFQDDQVAIFGANTSRIWPIRGGSLSSFQLEMLAHEFTSVPPDRVRLLVTHHPFDLPMAENRHLIVGHARRAIKRLAPISDILMAGHIHLSSTGSTARRYQTDGHALAFIQAGTAVSRRDKGEKNSFNSLTVTPGSEGVKSVAVETWTWRIEAGAFYCRCANHFRLESEGWARVPDAPKPENADAIQEDEGEPRPINSQATSP